MDAAESELEGDVAPQVTGGVVRYRLWPAWHKPVRTIVVLALVVAATGGAWYAYESFIWTLLAFLGMTAAFGIWIFPTSVALDGPMLHVRQFGVPRSFDLRNFRRMKITDAVLPRVELGVAEGASSMDTVRGSIVPLPAKLAARTLVIAHLERWVGQVGDEDDLDAPDIAVTAATPESQATSDDTSA